MKKVFNYLLILVITLATFWIIFAHVDFKEFQQILSKADLKYFGLALLCVFGFWGIEAGLIHMLLRKVYHDISFWIALKVTMVGQYYSHLTPFASGGQPVQIYYLSKDNVSVGNATAALVSKFLLFQITVNCFAFVTAVLRMSTILSRLRLASSFIFAGLIINMVGLVLIVLMAFKPIVIEKVLHILVRVLGAIKVIKNPEAISANIRSHLVEYLDSLHDMKADFSHTIMMFMASVVQITMLFSITWFIYKGLHLQGSTFLDVVSLQALVYIAVSLIPTPGSAGASEAAFTIMMSGVFTNASIAVGLVVWRGISFYFGFLFCGLFTMIIHLFENHIKSFMGIHHLHLPKRKTKRVKQQKPH